MTHIRATRILGDVVRKKSLGNPVSSSISLPYFVYRRDREGRTTGGGVVPSNPTLPSSLSVRLGGGAVGWNRKLNCLPFSPFAFSHISRAEKRRGGREREKERSIAGRTGEGTSCRCSNLHTESRSLLPVLSMKGGFFFCALPTVLGHLQFQSWTFGSFLPSPTLRSPRCDLQQSSSWKCPGDESVST